MDGENIALADWPLHETASPRAVVVLVHGLGEHIWRYDALAHSLNAWGYAVRGYDHYGHGESGGVRGALPSELRLLDDLAEVVDDTTRMYDARYERHVPLVLLGHSMGGVVAADFTRLRPKRVDGLVMSSPALDAELTWAQKTMLRYMPGVAPNMAVDNGVEVDHLCRDASVIAAYRADKLVHRKITPRLAKFIIDAGARVRSAAPKWQVPTLLMWAGEDKLVAPRGAKEFASAAPAALCEHHCYEEMYHEIFNDPHRDLPKARLRAWLDARFKLPAP